MEAATKLLDPGVNQSAPHFFKTMYETRQHSDVLLQAWGQKYPAHRLVLSLQSEYFAKKFLSYPSRGLKVQDISKDFSGLDVTDWDGHFDLEVGDDVTQKGFEVLLPFLYCCEGLSITLENAFDVLNCALFYQSQSLADQCFKFLMEGLCIDTFLSCYRWAQSHYHGPQGDEMTKACKDFMAVLMPGEPEKWSGIFCQLDPDFLKDVIRSTNLAVAYEYDRYLLAKRIISEFDLAAQVIASTRSEAAPDEAKKVSSTPSDGNWKLGIQSAATAWTVRQMLSECIEYAYMSHDQIIQIRSEGLVPEEALSQSLWYHEYLRYAFSKAQNMDVLKLSAAGADYQQKMCHPFSLVWSSKVGNALSGTTHSHQLMALGSIWQVKMDAQPRSVSIVRCQHGDPSTAKDTRASVQCELSVEVWWSSGTGTGAVKMLPSPLKGTWPMATGQWLYLGDVFKGMFTTWDKSDRVTIVSTIALVTSTSEF